MREAVGGGRLAGLGMACVCIIVVEGERFDLFVCRWVCSCIVGGDQTGIRMGVLIFF